MLVVYTYEGCAERDHGSYFRNFKVYYLSILGRRLLFQRRRSSNQPGRASKEGRMDWGAFEDRGKGHCIGSKYARLEHMIWKQVT